MNAFVFAVLVSCVALADGQVFCSRKGKLADRLQQNIRDNDINGDGIVTGAEMLEDSIKRYDRDGDNCLSRPEFVYHWVKDVKMSAGYALRRLSDILKVAGITTENPKCLYPYTVAEDPSSQLPINTFVNANLRTLVNFCEEDRSRYRTNCDCAQLPAVCLSDSFFKTFETCVNYNKNRN